MEDKHKVRTGLFLSICVIIGFFNHGNIAWAQDSIIVYRDVSGGFDESSRSNAHQLLSRAQRNGSIQVWLNFKVPVSIAPEDQTPELKARQQAAAREAFERIVQPLIERGSVTRHMYSEFEKGPTCLVEVDAAGMARLLRAKEILQYIS